MHVCVDDCPFINRIELKLIFLDYKGNLWYVRYVKIGISSYVVLDYLQKRKSIGRGSTCEVFHHCVSPGVDSNHKFERLHSCKDCICCAVRQCKFSDDFSNY